jgi:hypothetical protein
VKRGRPPKFGRPARLVALTLPDDVLAWLQTINADPAWAIVSLFERERPARPTEPDRTPPTIELVSIGARRALIVVRQAALHGLRGVSMVPLSAGRAFLALEPGKGMADLELAVVDQLEEKGLSETEREALKDVRRQLRAWREDKEFTFTGRSIIIVEQAGRRKVTRQARHR